MKAEYVAIGLFVVLLAVWAWCGLLYARNKDLERQLDNEQGTDLVKELIEDNRNMRAALAADCVAEMMHGALTSAAVADKMLTRERSRHRDAQKELQHARLALEEMREAVDTLTTRLAVYEGPWVWPEDLGVVVDEIVEAVLPVPSEKFITDEDWQRCVRTGVQRGLLAGRDMRTVDKARRVSFRIEGDRLSADHIREAMAKWGLENKP